MNEKFYSLPIEKQNRIINSAFEVFAKNEYKKASTELMAQKAGISKGLLFHYFHNKKELYTFLIQYATKQMTDTIINADFYAITDFFELLNYGARIKYHMVVKNPYLMDFFMGVVYSDTNETTNYTNKYVNEQIEKSYDKYFKNIDFSKFKDDVDPKQIMEMLTWMTQGYLQEKLRVGNVKIEDVMQDFDTWAVMFKKMTYKEEFLNGYN